jgi:hypothetical protein
MSGETVLSGFTLDYRQLSEIISFSQRTEMSAEVKKEIKLEIAHVLFLDIVGYSKLSTNDQHAAVEELNQIVRSAAE